MINLLSCFDCNKEIESCEFRNYYFILYLTITIIIVSLVCLLICFISSYINKRTKSSNEFSKEVLNNLDKPFVKIEQQNYEDNLKISEKCITQFTTLINNQNAKINKIDSTICEKIEKIYNQTNNKLNIIEESLNFNFESLKKEINSNSTIVIEKLENNSSEINNEITDLNKNAKELQSLINSLKSIAEKSIEELNILKSKIISLNKVTKSQDIINSIVENKLNETNSFTQIINKLDEIMKIINEESSKQNTDLLNGDVENEK